MQKEELKKLRREINDTKTMLGEAIKRLEDGRYESAVEKVTWAVAELQRLKGELRDIIEIHRYEK
ncbi:hypothetical protein KTQ81_21705 [Salmonella enterica subsp. diarizonae]|uniref:hypothetical protein n=1 Tax=Salmonella enterica TaxID=28901 RepID=UPI001CF4F836|nr:hypothetical protein [Salmonella enterica subsp. diarizonae]